MGARRSEEQIPDSRQPHERARARTKADGKSLNLSEPDRYEKRPSVVTESESARDSRGDRNDVLERAGELDTHQIRRSKDAQRGKGNHFGGEC